MAYPALASATRLAPVEEAQLRLKIHCLLAACRDHGATHLVLSALGCGAFRNPPDHVAALFREALQPPPALADAAAGVGGAFGDGAASVASIFDGCSD